MPHEPPTTGRRSRFRVSLGGAMSAVVVLACMFAAWQATRIMVRPTTAWITWSHESKDPTRVTAPGLFNAAKAQAISDVTASKLASGVRVISPPGTLLIGIQRGTGSPAKDADAVDAVVAALIKSRPPGTFELLARAKGGVAWNQGPTLARRIIATLAAGLWTIIGLVFLRRSVRALGWLSITISQADHARRGSPP